MDSLQHPLVDIPPPTETTDQKIKRLEEQMAAHPFRPDNYEKEVQRLRQFRADDLASRGAPIEELAACTLQVELAAQERRMEWQQLYDEYQAAKQAKVVEIANSAKLQAALAKKREKDQFFEPLYYMVIAAGAVILLQLAKAAS